MPGQRFASEIERNRLLTNWAAVHLSGKRDIEAEVTNERLFRFWQRFKNLVAPRIVALVAGVAILAITLMGQISLFKPTGSSKALATSAPPSATPTPNLDSTLRCSEVALHNALDDQVAAVPLIPESFLIVGRQQFGGALFMKLNCNEPVVGSSFQVEWLLTQGKWQLKQISRLPTRQSGDLANIY